jgi:hypothetical protein
MPKDNTYSTWRLHLIKKTFLLSGEGEKLICKISFSGEGE